MMSRFIAHLPPPSYGEVARRAGGGRPQSRYLQVSDLKFRGTPVWPSPSAPFGGTSPFAPQKALGRGRHDSRVIVSEMAMKQRIFGWTSILIGVVLALVIVESPPIPSLHIAHTHYTPPPPPSA